MPNELQDKSMHSLGQMIASRDATIKRLEKELAEARVGGQPASKLRDAVLPVLLIVAQYCEDGQPGNALQLLKNLLGHLKSIPSLEAPSDKVADKNYGKLYKPLDHGKPER